MRDDDRALRSNRVVFPDGIRPATVIVRDQTIARIGPHNMISERTLDYGDLVIMPGIVDTHVHINEPGRTEWEGFHTATMSAAAGGVTTIVDMPLNSIPPTTTSDALEAKIAAARGNVYIDVGFWGGVVSGNAHELAGIHEKGAFGFKCFLVPSGVPEFEAANESVLRDILPELADFGVPLLVHAELPELIDSAIKTAEGKNPRIYWTWLQSRPKEAEDQAVELLIKLAEQCKAKIHVVHLSSATAIPRIREAKRRGVTITVETCPHYLTINAEEVPDGATAYKCAPPIRDSTNQRELWAALEEDVIDFIVSDHSPAPPEMKCCETGDFMRAWGGIASLQLTLPLVWTAARKRGIGIERVADWLCRRPSKMAALPRKGEIREGCYADLVIWNPEDLFEVCSDLLLFRHKLTPYAGRELFGIVQATYLRGEQIYCGGKITGPPRGRVLRRGQA